MTDRYFSEDGLPTGRFTPDHLAMRTTGLAKAMDEELEPGSRAFCLAALADLLDSVHDVQSDYLVLDRQLAEAERENGRLREFILTHRCTNCAAEAQDILNPPDPPASPAEGSEHGHTQECDDYRYLGHVATGDDPPCICPPAEGSEADHARAEHLREALEVEHHQERKHAARGSE